MNPRCQTVLFLCTGNSARSIMAEALVNARGAGRFRAFSAGSHPKGQVHRMALETLRRHDVPVDGLRSKSWNEFAAPDAPVVDLVVTVCDHAAAEICPIWPGHPTKVHWSIADPASAEGTEGDRDRAFEDAYQALEARIAALLRDGRADA